MTKLGHFSFGLQNEKKLTCKDLVFQNALAFSSSKSFFAKTVPLMETIYQSKYYCGY